MAKLKDQYEVIRDTREQKGWDFEPEEFSNAICLGTREDTLKTGDYTLVGYESVLCIERKLSVSEFAMSITAKRFERELVRMLEYPHRFLVCEFRFEDVIRFPAGSNIPPYSRDLLRVTPQFLVKRINEVMLKYQVPVIFAGNKGKEFVSSLFKRVVENVAKPVSV